MIMKEIKLNETEMRLVLEQFVYYGSLPIHKKYTKLKKKIETALKKQPIKISSRKAKGRELQKWVCRKIADIFGIEFNQQDDECLIHSREMGQAGADVILRGHIAKQFPFTIECKNTEQISLPNFIKQARDNTPENKKMLLVIRNKTLKDPIAVLDWDTFERLIKIIFSVGYRIEWK